MIFASAAAPVAVKSVTGTLTAAGVWSGVVVMGLLIVLAVVKILPRLRELEINNNAGLRKEFIEEMAALRDEVKQLRAENGQLRDEIRELHGVIDGMRRANLQAGNSAARAVAEALPEGAVPPATRAALKRIAGEQ